MGHMATTREDLQRNREKAIKRWFIAAVIGIPALGGILNQGYQSLPQGCLEGDNGKVYLVRNDGGVESEPDFRRKVNSDAGMCVLRAFDVFRKAVPIMSQEQIATLQPSPPKVEFTSSPALK